MKTVYGVLACILIIGAIGGGRLNLEQIAAGKGVPKDPAKRAPYIVGMFIPSTVVGALGVWLGYLALRPKNESQDRNKPAPTEIRDYLS